MIDQPIRGGREGKTLLGVNIGAEGKTATVIVAARGRPPATIELSPSGDNAWNELLAEFVREQPTLTEEDLTDLELVLMHKLLTGS